MSVRAMRARAIVDPATLDQLQRTNSVHNVKVRQLVPIIFQMLRRECGETPGERSLYNTIGHFILANTQNADYLLNAVCKSGSAWKPGAAQKYKATIPGQNGLVEIAGTSWADAAAEFSRRGRRLFDKNAPEWFGCLRGSSIPQFACCDAAAAVASHFKLRSLWNREHEAWLKRRAEWEADEENRLYLKVHDRFEQFYASAGAKAAKRRERWHLYLDWLRSSPDLAAWRAKAEAKIHPLDANAERRIANAKPWRKRSVEAEEFWKANPEVHALHRLHCMYEREFVRRGKRRNPDGFKHQPTWSNPESVTRWFVFKRNDGYRNLRLPVSPRKIGTVELKLIVGENDGTYTSRWIPIKFKGDPRLSDFCETVRPSKRKSSSREKVGYLWFDRRLEIRNRIAEIKGIKLMLDLTREGTARAAHLIFSCDIKDEKLSDLAKKVKDEFSEELAKSGKKKFKGRLIPKGLVSVAVDIGLRHAAFATLARWDGSKIDVLRARAIRLDSPETGSPDLQRIGDHKRTLRDRRSKRGNPVAGEESHIELQSHITNMSDDRFKKAARAIVNFGLNIAGDRGRKTGQPFPRADIVLVEELGNLKPDATYERGVNQQIATFNHGHIVDQIERIAADTGLKFKKVYAWGSSQVCNQCGSLGVRYGIERVADQPGQRKAAAIRFGGKRPLFACSKCLARKPGGRGYPYTCNADFNASVNHQRRFYLGNDSVFGFAGPKDERAARIKSIEERLEPLLRELHGLTAHVVETPW